MNLAHTRRQLLLRRQKGFTIVELIVVIVILGILAVLVYTSYSKLQNDANEASVRTDLRNIANQVELYRADLGVYPSTAQMNAMRLRVNKKAYGVNPTGATGFYCVNSDGSAYAVVTRVRSQLLLVYNSYTNTSNTYTGSTTAPQLCTDAGVTTTTYLAFTNNGVWNDWVATQ